MDKERIDTASEPVDNQDDEFMDTGVLHPKKSRKADEAEGEDEASE